MSSIWKVVSVPITFVLAFLMQFWWLYLILLAIGAYKTAAKEWGAFAGIISVLVAFVLPILTIYLWGEAIGKEDGEKRYSKGKQKDGKHGSVPNNDDFGRHQSAYLRLLSAMMAKMATADGRIDASEIRAAEAAFGRLGFSDIQKQVCILAFRNALIATHHISYYACQLVEKSTRDEELRRLLILVSRTAGFRATEASDPKLALLGENMPRGHGSVQ